MILDLTSRGNTQLSPFELCLLVTGVKATDSYTDPILIIRASPIVCSQIKLITRWGAGFDLKTERERPGIADFEEVL